MRILKWWKTHQSVAETILVEYSPGEPLVKFSEENIIAHYKMGPFQF